MAAAVKPVFAWDDRGQEWVVYKDDAAWPFIRALWMRGVRDIVLPRASFTTGRLTWPRTRGTIVSWDVQNEAVAAQARRLVRLRDCVAWLHSHPVENDAEDTDVGH